jgi:hypothetical protein
VLGSQPTPSLVSLYSPFSLWLYILLLNLLFYSCARTRCRARQLAATSWARAKWSTVTHPLRVQQHPQAVLHARSLDCTPRWNSSLAGRPPTLADKPFGGGSRVSATVASGILTPSLHPAGQLADEGAGERSSSHNVRNRTSHLGSNQKRLTGGVTTAYGAPAADAHARGARLVRESLHKQGIPAGGV